MDQDSRNSEPRRPKIMGDGEGTVMPMNEADVEAMLAQTTIAQTTSPAAPQPHGRASEVAGPRASGPVPTAAGELSAPAGELCAPAAPAPAAPPAATGLSGPMPTAAPSSVGLEDWIPDTPSGATFIGPVDGNDELAHYRQPDDSIIERPTFWPDQMRLSALHIAVHLGIPIFPCQETGPSAKAPRTRRGLKDATTVESAIDFRWRQWAQAMIGMPTGPVSGVFIVDIDVKNGADGFAALAELETRYGPLPKTKRVNTPSGGAHIYFNMPEGLAIPNSASKIAPGIDVRGDGGYVILPPSRILDAAGKRLGTYAWNDPNERVAHCPEWLLSLVTAKGGQKKPNASHRIFTGASWQERVIDQHCQSVIEAQKGSRNDELNRVAFALGQMLTMRGFEREKVEAQLIDAAKACGLLNEPDGERRVRRTIQSGLDAGMADPIEHPPYPVRNKKTLVPDPNSLDNVRVLLDWMNVGLWYNLFAYKEMVDGTPPRTVLDDQVMHKIWGKAQDTGFRAHIKTISTSLKTLALGREVHPVRDYFDSLEWDGTKRLDDLMSKYFGAEPSKYHASVGSKALIAAIRRVRKPGTKFDTMLVLEGVEGTGKSTAMKILATRDEWFTDNLTLMDKTKEIMEKTGGKLIVEIPELKGNKGAAAEHIKAMLSRTTDAERMAYKEFVGEQPRQFILVATTNEFDYLKSDTGNRRFWPVKTAEIDLEALKQDRDQLWAEAVHREAQGEGIELPRELWAEASIQQQARMGTDPWKETLEDALGDLEGKIPCEDIWTIVDKRAGQRSQGDKTRVGNAMRELGWRREKQKINGRNRWCYLKGEAPHEHILIAPQQNGMPPLVTHLAEAPDWVKALVAE